MMLQMAALRKRHASGEGGFTIVEVMAALIILATAVLSLAYTASIGFAHTARARKTEAATQMANRATEILASYDKDIILAGLYPSDSTIAQDTHISGGNCVNTTGVDLECNGEALIETGLVTSPLNPHKTTETDPTTGSDYDVWRLVTQAEEGGVVQPDLVRLTAIVTYTENGEIITRSYSTLYDTVSGESLGAQSEFLDGSGTITGGALAITGTMASGSFTNADINMAEVSGAVVSSPASVTATSKTLGVSMTGGLPTTPVPATCGAVSSASGATQSSDTYCDGSAANASLGLNTGLSSSLVTITWITLLKFSKDLPTTGAAVADLTPATTGGFNGICDTTADDFPCAKASDDPNGSGTGTSTRLTRAQVNLYAATGSKGTCDFARSYEPVAGQSTSSVVVDRDEAVGSNTVTVTATRSLPDIAIGCFPTTPSYGTLGSSVGAGGLTNMGTSTVTQTVAGTTTFGTTTAAQNAAGVMQFGTTSATQGVGGTTTVGSTTATQGIGGTTTMGTTTSTQGVGGTTTMGTTSAAQGIGGTTTMGTTSAAQYAGGVGTSVGTLTSALPSSGTVTTLGTVSSDNGMATTTGALTTGTTAIPATCTVAGAPANGSTLWIADTTLASSEKLTLSNPAPSCPGTPTATTFNVTRGMAPTTAITHASGQTLFRANGATIGVTLASFGGSVTLAGQVILVGSEKMSITSCTAGTGSCTTGGGTATLTVGRGGSGTDVYKHSSGNTITFVTPPSYTPLTASANVSGVLLPGVGNNIKIDSEEMTIASCSPTCSSTGAVTYTFSTRPANATTLASHLNGASITWTAPAPTTLAVTVATPVPSGTVLTVGSPSETETITACSPSCVSTGAVTYTVTRGVAATHPLGATVTYNAPAPTDLAVTVTTPVASGTVLTVGSELETISACTPSCASTGAVTYTVTRGTLASHPLGTSVTYNAPVPTTLAVNVTVAVPVSTVLTVGSETETIIACAPGCASTGAVTYTVTRGTVASHAIGTTITYNAPVPTTLVMNVTTAVPSGTVLLVGSESETITACSPNCTSTGAVTYTVTRGTVASHASGTTVTYNAPIPTTLAVTVTTAVPSGTVLTVGSENETITACSPNCTSTGAVTYTVTRGTLATHASGTAVTYNAPASTSLSVNVTTAVPSGTILRIDSENETITACSPNCTSTGAVTYTVTRGTTATAIVAHTSGTSVTYNAPTSTSLSVNVTVPQAVNTILYIGSEQEKITACSPNCTTTGVITYTVTRAQNSTTAAQHNSGTTVQYNAAAPTSIQVVETGSHPSVGNVVTIDNESMTISSMTLVSGTTYDYVVVRGANSTTVASHSSGAAVTNQYTPTSYYVNGAIGTWNASVLSTWNNPPAVTGWTGGGFLVRLRDVVETVTVESGVGASAPTYSRTGNLDYWNGTSYVTTPLTATQASSAIAYTLPQLRWVGSTTSMCLGAEATSSGTSGVPTAAYSGSVATGTVTSSGTSPVTAASGAGVASLLSGSYYLHMSNSTASCTATNGGNNVEHFYISPVTGATFTASTAYATS